VKRDMELVLNILKYLDKREEITAIEELEIPGYSSDVVAYHCRRMYEAGFLDAEATFSKTTPSRLVKVRPFGLTWEGHEFLDSLRNDTIAQKVRNRLGGALADVPFALIKELALAFGRAQLMGC
jgi:Hypothetical protein (DUF2513)